MDQFNASYGVQRKIDTFSETLTRHEGGSIQLRIVGLTPVRGFYVNVEALPMPMIAEIFNLVKIQTNENTFTL